jgi:hypothetical protein
MSISIQTTFKGSSEICFKLAQYAADQLDSED